MQGALIMDLAASAPTSTEFTPLSNNPWVLCFPPQVQMNVQKISDRLKVEPSNFKTTQLMAQVVTTHVPSNGSFQLAANASSNADAVSNNTKRPVKSRSNGRQGQRHASAEGSWGYELEHTEDVDGNIYALPLEQSAAIAYSDDDSVTSWSSQNAVKFNKKLKPKVADHGLTPANSALVDPAAQSRDHKWGSKLSFRMGPLETDGNPEEDRASRNSSSKDESLIFQEDRDEIEAGTTLIVEPQSRQIQLDETDEDAELYNAMKSALQVVPAALNVPSTPTSTRFKKSVRFTDPLVTCQYFRPKTRPEEVSLLFFDERELELLEDDRETTSRDQFEMIAQELSENRLRISIAYQNRWRYHQKRRNSSSLTTSEGNR